MLRERDYVRMDKNRFIPEDKGRLVTAFLEQFFKRYVTYDFTAALEEKLDMVSAGEMDYKELLREFWTDFHAAVGDIGDLRVSQVLDALNDTLGPHIFPDKEDGTDPRACKTCGTGQLSLKAGKFGAFIGCSNYPECRFTRPIAAEAGGEGQAEGGGDRELGTDPVTGRDRVAEDRPLRPLCGAGRRPGRRQGQAQARQPAQGLGAGGDGPGEGPAPDQPAARGRACTPRTGR